jgi:hypothetical protein
MPGHRSRRHDRTRAAAIESHPGAENGVEESSAEPGITLGFVHAEGVLAGCRAHRYEAHGARPEVGDTRQVHPASALPRELDEWPVPSSCGIEA